MARLTLSSIGPLLKKQRNNKGIREVATEIGISSATLSRIENGKLPDLESFSKICKWLNVDPGKILGFKPADTILDEKSSPQLFAHMRADKNQNPELVKALSEMILQVQQMTAEKS